METQAFIKKLKALEPSKSTAEKFRDFCELAYCAYAKPMAAPEQHEILEARYMHIVGTYRNKDAIRAYPELIVLVSQGIEFGDFLGTVAAEIGALNGDQGQFFTPFEVSYLMAQMLFGDIDETIEAQGYLTVQEPASGSGGMILALAKTMRQRGYNPNTQLFVCAIDISAQCFWMCYLQLALAGIPAQVIRGNSLSLETFETAWTRATVPFLDRHGDIFTPKTESPIQSVTLAPSIVPVQKVTEIKQLGLF
jgi:hypothetical protein